LHYPGPCGKISARPDTHDGNPRWWKIVLMDHVRESLLEHFLNNLEKEKTKPT
jgi:hypothetical protein